MKALVEAIWFHTHKTSYNRRQWNELWHNYVVHLPKVLQECRNLHQLLGLPFPLGNLGPCCQVLYLLSHPLVLGLQHFNRMFQ